MGRNGDKVSFSVRADALHTVLYNKRLNNLVFLM